MVRRILRLSSAPFRYGLLLVALGELASPRETVADESRSCSIESDVAGLVASGSLKIIYPLCLIGANVLIG